MRLATQSSSITSVKVSATGKPSHAGVGRFGSRPLAAPRNDGLQYRRTSAPGPAVSARRLEITLTVNGEPIAARVEARTTLVDFLRDDLALTGSHVGCEHGVC